MRTVRRTAVAALVAATVTTGLAVPAQAKPRPDRTFDVQAHRGGLGLRVENTLASFGNALQLGVSTLELDVQITEDVRPSSPTTARSVAPSAPTPPP